MLLIYGFMACRLPSTPENHTLRLSSLWILFHGLIVNGMRAASGWKRTWSSTFSPVCSAYLLHIFLRKNHFVWADWLRSWFCTELLTQATSCMRIIRPNDPGCTAGQTQTCFGVFWGFFVFFGFFLHYETLAKAKELNENLLFYIQLDFDMLTRILTPLDNYFSIQQIHLNCSPF